MDYGKLLKDIRLKKKQGQIQLAQRLYCCQSHVSLIERNKINPSRRLAKLITDYARRLRMDLSQYE